MHNRFTHALLPALLLWIAGSVFYPACRLAARTARPPVCMGYYDTDRLYDTIPSDFYNDTDFTPEGRYAWNTARYERKIRNTAAVADSMGLDLLVLWGVENEDVVRDLSRACTSDYTYLHRTLNSFDGRDFALLYHADKFAPKQVRTHRKTLIVIGRIYPDSHPERGIDLCLVACNDPRQTAPRIEALREEFPEHLLVVMGELPGRIPDHAALRDPFAQSERKGYGNLWRKGGWTLRDRIWTDVRIKTVRGEIHARSYLFDTKRNMPLPTFSANRYTGGFGRALPVFVCF